LSSKTPHNIFTPRSSEVNPQMYISRPEDEKTLIRAIRGTLHVLVHGESGTGKTWLYQRVLKENSVYFATVNLANASRFGSITNAIERALEGLEESKKIGYDETKAAGLDAIVIKTELKHEGKYNIGQKEPLQSAFRHIRNSANSETAIIVFDNLESIFTDKKLMRELGDIITVLDDPEYSKYNVKMLIVGVPSEVREYFSTAENRQTISNRLYELPEIARLTVDQVRDFILRGFRAELQYDLLENEIAPLTKHIAWVTDGAPQRLHEYCLALAFVGEDSGRRIRCDMLDRVDVSWLSSSFSKDFVSIQALMNERETKAGRRNQTLYALGKITKDFIRGGDIEDIVRKEFPNSTGNLALNISAMLSELSASANPIIKRSPKGDTYVFSDPKFRICIRVMLRKNQENEKVYHVNASAGDF
jgi:AAA domain